MFKAVYFLRFLIHITKWPFYKGLSLSTPVISIQECPFPADSAASNLQSASRLGEEFVLFSLFMLLIGGEVNYFDEY